MAPGEQDYLICCQVNHFTIVIFLVDFVAGCNEKCCRWKSSARTIFGEVIFSAYVACEFN